MHFYKNGKEKGCLSGSRTKQDFHVCHCLHSSCSDCQNKAWMYCCCYWSAESLQVVPVVSYADIEKRMEEGTTNRTVAATNMNATSRSVSTSAQCVCVLSLIHI